MRLLGMALLASVTLSCGSARTLDSGLRRHGTTWKDDIAPLLATPAPDLMAVSP